VIRSICLVSPGHPGSNPRLVKEAEALVEAGHRVHVIYGETHAGALERDQAVLAGVIWTSQAVSLFTHRWQTLAWKTGQRFATLLFKRGFRTLSLACRASHPLFPGLRRAVLNYKADIYLGHCLPALPIVVAAARRHRALCGFDAEDFHSGENAEEGHGAVSNAIARLLESHLLPECDHLTAASPLIAKAYEATYGVAPTTILNVFPLLEAVEPRPAPSPPSFYWFSQTVGPGRGIEAMLGILRLLDRPLRIDLRGHISDDYRKSLEAAVAGSEVVLGLLPPDAPATMVGHAAGYTAGLALEQRAPLNRDLCLTNKAFTFLLAGTPVIFSRTCAQEALADELGNAALLIDLDDPSAAAKALRSWIENPELHRRSRESAHALGKTRYNWDYEKHLLLNMIDSATP
jgi:glycosyltransferase involved in cell wall biosynthesis